MNFDYFFEPSEYEIMMGEFKQSIIDNVRSDIQKKIKSLEDENRELKYKLEHLDELEAEAKEEKLKFELKLKNALSEAKKQRIADLISDVGDEAWSVDVKKEYIHEKCDKCDDNRKIHFLSPSGKKLEEPCECSKIRSVYCPIKVFLGKMYFDKELKQVNFYIQRAGVLNCSDEAYVIGTDDNYFYRKYGGESFDKVDRFRTFFMEKNDCERFCEYLKEKEEKRDWTI